MGDDEMVSLLVPKRYYGQMIQALATAMQGGAQDSVPGIQRPTDSELDRSDNIDWTDIENCRRLRDHLQNRAALAMLGLAADNPGEPIYISDVMEHAACSHGQASSGNGAITKAIRVQFNSKSDWPAPYQWDKEKAVAYYVMTQQVAESWKKASIPMKSWTLNAKLGYYVATGVRDNKILLRLHYRDLAGAVSEVGVFELNLDELAELGVVTNRGEAGFDLRILRDEDGVYALSVRNSECVALEDYRSA